MSKEELEALDELRNLHSSNYNWNWNTNNPNNPSDLLNDHHDMSNRSAEGVTSVVLSIAFITFIVFLICLCCPCCLLAKYRKRRGHVYGQAPAPIVAQTIPQNGTAITINHAQRVNPPYPVQPSVTHAHASPQPYPQPYHQYGSGSNQSYPHYGNVPPHHQGQSQMSMPMPMHNNDLPPPYPGLPKETMTYSQSANVSHPQPAFNPYYGETESGQANSTNYPSKY